MIFWYLHTMEYLKQKAAQLPLTPGIYLMKDQHGQIIYVGKAKNLKNRVQSYFRHNPNHSNKVLRMIFNIVDFETIDVQTELDALLLECQYIQRYHPLYNRQMNYYQNYLYVGIVADEIVLSPEYRTGFWGPFRQYKSLPDLVICLNDTFLLPKTNHLTRLAIQRQLPQLEDMAIDQRLKSIKGLFTGRSTDYFQLLEARIRHASEHLNFELAGKLQADFQHAQQLYDYILRRKTFLKQKELIFSLPITTDENDPRKKYYQVSYGRIIQTKVADEQPDFQPPKQKNSHLEKAEVDPTDILISYYRRFIQPAKSRKV